MTRLEVVRGDITRLDVDAIVNAANPTLLGGGGVDGAIHAAAGRGLVEACRALPEVRPGVRCSTGQARITPGFGLKARFVIHTVGPVFQDGKQGEGELLASCYRQSLGLAREYGLRSIAFPAIGTGVYGVPSYFGSAVAASTCAEFLWHDTTLERVLLVAFRELDEAYLRERIRRANLPPTGLGARVAEAWVTRDPDQYKSDDLEYDARLLLGMLDGHAGSS
jgi:O-acetyl-ADP-ribose deacetylase